MFTWKHFLLFCLFSIWWPLNNYSLKTSMFLTKCGNVPKCTPRCILCNICGIIHTHLLPMHAEWQKALCHMFPMVFLAASCTSPTVLRRRKYHSTPWIGPLSDVLLLRFFQTTVFWVWSTHNEISSFYSCCYLISLRHVNLSTYIQ